MLSGLGWSIHSVGDGELVAKIHELSFKDVKSVGGFDGYCDEM